MLKYETHKNVIEKIFNLINSGRFYSLTFIKKGDGQIRYLNGHRMIYKKDDGSSGIIKNVGYDPQNHNLIRVWDRNAENPKTGKKTGNYRSVALENILYVKSGNDFFDFVTENKIMERFPYFNENTIISIKEKIKSNSLNENILLESLNVMNIMDLAEMIGRLNTDYYQPALEILRDAFRSGGDEEVKKKFEEFTNTEITPVGHGKYVFKL